MLSIAPALFELIGRLTAATTVPSVWDAYITAARHAGFSHGLACTTYPGRPLAHRVAAISVPAGWLAHYSAQDYGPHNPLIERTRKALRPYEWAATDWDATLTPVQRHWRDDCIGAGMAHGICVPNIAGGEGKAIYLAGQSDDVHPNDLTTLYLAGLEALLRMRELSLDGEAKHLPALSGREAECLKWVAAGKSDWEIGAILSLSEKTVNIYIERAKHKLCVPTRAQAVVVALRGGLIGL